MTERQQTTITRNTRLTIGVALTIFGGIVFQLQQQNETNLAIKEVQRDILELRRDLIELSGDLWTGREMQHWAELLKSENPGLNVPSVQRR